MRGDFSKLKDYAELINKVSKFDKVLELGCGKKKLPFSYGVDIKDYQGVDEVLDLNVKMPFKDESFNVVISNQVLEHISELNTLMSESYRVLDNGGIFVATVPYFRSSWSVIDPTHVRCFSINTMDYFVDGTLFYEAHPFIEKGFSKSEIHIDLLSVRPWYGRGLANLAKRYPSRFENSFLSFVYPFQDITWVLTK
jgi:SAM-dependent methyltransferase